MVDSVNAGKDRAPSLDMLRGYAALIVVFAHTTVAGLYKVEPLWGWLKWTPLRVLWAGHQAVIVFFMLSGYALAHMYGELRSRRYLTFAAARIVRLYPPFIGSLVVAVGLYWLVGRAGYVWERGWMYTAHPVLDKQVIFDHLKMIGSYDTGAINPPMWSIVHEMRWSLAFPIIAFLVNRFRFKAVIAAVVSSTLIGIAALAGSPTHIPWPLQDALLTTHYGTFFVIGAWFYSCRFQIVDRVTALPAKSRTMWWIAALVLFSYPFDNPWSIGGRIFGDLGVSIGAFLLMALSFTIKEGRAYSIGHWLGKISYSLYLNHYVILSVSLVVLYTRFGPVPVWIATICGALVLAFVMNRLVEVPSQNWARALRRRLSPKAAERSSNSANLVQR
ncbi:acyltransferase [Paraburkholderia sp. BL17N1]|uniref:acyltransferase family protein n=1 Tax=Paraburkholderia sp. BL17N1 TaxID=1938798 RepID=UPI000EB34A23|nr:acyltransferase [Paraburkholderia sp. BL17N1]RKR42918.1 peptidoglycan/LPS O-acetylase OafA/YrhL [Paraburkholderia sp. BL17N1]